VPRRLVRALFVLSMLTGVFGMVSAELTRAAEGRQVTVLPTTGIVDQVMANYLSEGVARATRDGALAVVIKLNTPGGDLEATNAIVGTILEADLPVIVWVAPAGGRAASAGTFITLAGHVALMAPGTSIGAASPVTGGGEDIPDTLRDKIFNDTAARIKAIAEERGRNAEWAEAAVREAVSAGPNDAVAQNIIDGIASSIEEVLTFSSGRQVTVGGATVTLDLAGAAAEELHMNPFQGFIHLLSDPNIAALLFSVGSLGLVYEVITPNFVTGIVGALMIILAFIGFGSLPLNVGGLLLIGLGVLLLVLEVTVISHGLLTVGGLVCFALGLSALYTQPGLPGAPDVSVAFPLILAMTLTVAAFMALALVTVLRQRRRSPVLAALGYGAGGSSAVAPGTTGEVRMALDPIGSVYAAGEEWTARSPDGALPRGTLVVVEAQDGLTLIVRRAERAGSPA
jgi:membrane-bound serine protease (ClpP class)